jgi:hypothetical protein
MYSYKNKMVVYHESLLERDYILYAWNRWWRY